MKKFFGTITRKEKAQSQLPQSPSMGKFTLEDLNSDEHGNSNTLMINRHRKSIVLKKSPSLNLPQGKYPVESNISEQEIEPYCINYAYEWIRSKKLLKNDANHDELLTALIARQAYDQVRGQLQVAPEYHIDLVHKHLDNQIPKACTKVLKGKKNHIQDAKLLVGQSMAYSEKGIREYNEDKHLCLPYLHEFIGDKAGDSQPFSLFGVFDGHGGSVCADYVSRHIAINICRHDSINRNVQSALHDAFVHTNEQWKDTVLRNGLPETCGSTGVVALFSNRDLYVAWAGDSSAMLFLKNGVWLDFIVPHKPTNEAERLRVESMGGQIISDRVNGILAVTRSFGDLKYGCVNSEPDIIQYRLQGQESFLILACDGLTDVMSPIDVMETVKKTLAEPDGDHLVSQRLVDAALNKGSTDNVSVVYVPLQHVEKPQEIITVLPSSYKKEDQQNILYKKPVVGSFHNIDGVGIFAKPLEQKFQSGSKMSGSKQSGLAKGSSQNISDPDGDITPPMQPEDFEPDPMQLNVQAMTRSRTISNANDLAKDKASSSNSQANNAKTTTLVAKGSGTKTPGEKSSQEKLVPKPPASSRNWKDPNVHALSELSALAALARNFSKDPQPLSQQVQPVKQVADPPQVASEDPDATEVAMVSEFNEDYVISFSAYEEASRKSSELPRRTSHNVEDVIASYGNSSPPNGENLSEKGSEE